MKKICIVINSRANYGRIKSVMLAINNHPGLELNLIVGASALLYRYGSAIEVIKKDGFKPNGFLYSIVEGENPVTMAKSTGLGIIELSTQFEIHKPDVVLTVADRFETMATAISASYMNIPLAHTQGGEVTGSIDDSVRHAITKLSHIHFPATSKAAEFIKRMGEREETIHITGCPSIDLLAEGDLSLSKDIFKKYQGTGFDLDISEDYLLVLQHPVTTEYGSGLKQIEETLDAIKKILEKNQNLQAVWLWPNVDAGSDHISKGIRKFRERNRNYKIHFYRNFSPEDYAKVLNNCKCIIGNSSSGIREASFLGIPSVNIGSRQSDRERSNNVIDVNYNSEEIYNAINKQLNQSRYPKNFNFGYGNSGKLIAEKLYEGDIQITKKISYV